MSGTFWVSETDLDNDQVKAVRSMDESASFLVRGPAGSGKTNILLLRAKWFRLKKLTDFKIVVFTASLRDFLREGSSLYGVPKEDVVTSIQFFRNFLAEYGADFEPSGSFEADRALLAGKAQSLIEGKHISNIFEALLIDEAQDYMDTELNVFRALAKRLILVADSRQSIYRTTHTPELLEKLVDKSVVDLKYHYRSGLKICTVADAILKDSVNFLPLRGECKYDEHTRPSSLVAVKCNAFNDQVKEILSKLPGQLDLYPGEYIGVIFPKREQEVQFRSALESASMPGKERIRVDTLHGAKGWEFRAVHVAGCEALYKMGPTQKRLVYTAILRGKTAVSIYYSGNIPGYLESAIGQLSPPAPDPPVADLFKI